MQVEVPKLGNCARVVDGGRGDWRGCTRIGTRFAMVPTKDSTQEADRHTKTVQGTQVKLM
jgi:hypothetical protein